jgi:hypothetical protein
MQWILNTPQRQYVLFHLSQHIRLNGISKHFFFCENPDDVSRITDHIIFICSSAVLRRDSIKVIDGIPVLFPFQETMPFYYSDNRGNVIFTHDILKSAFYLLSGYQEHENIGSKDQLGRFSYLDSIQCQMNFTDKPVVNYYFVKIIEGIEKFCASKNIQVKKRRLFEKFGFILSHDVDSVDLYTKSYVLFKIKEILQLRKSKRSVFKNLSLFFHGSLKYLGIRKKDNPHWNFDFMRELERNKNFRSVFYFLDTGILHSDAYYTFGEPRILDLFRSLQKEHCEIGLHGPVRSVTDETVMRQSLEKLARYSQAKIVGVRQHRLLWKHPETAKIQKKAGLEYDTTLGFAAHEGFRNSYCLPFKLYDFQRDCPIDIWEYPLNVMDVTLFAYRGYTVAEAMKKSMDLVAEIKRFGGVFSLLWHNSFFDEDTYPGVTGFYQQLLAEIAGAQAENILGNELLDKLKTFSAHE